MEFVPVIFCIQARTAEDHDPQNQLRRDNLGSQSLKCNHGACMNLTNIGWWGPTVLVHPALLYVFMSRIIASYYMQCSVDVIGRPALL